MKLSTFRVSRELLQGRPIVLKQPNLSSSHAVLQNQSIASLNCCGQKAAVGAECLRDIGSSYLYSPSPSITLLWTCNPKEIAFMCPQLSHVCYSLQSSSSQQWENKVWPFGYTNDVHNHVHLVQCNPLKAASIHLPDLIWSDHFYQLMKHHLGWKSFYSKACLLALTISTFLEPIKLTLRQQKSSDRDASFTAQLSTGLKQSIQIFNN